MGRINFRNFLYHFLPIINPIKYSLQNTLNTYSKTLNVIFKSRLFSSTSSVRWQVRFTQFITLSRAAQMTFLFLFADLSIQTRLLHYDFNYLNGFPAGNRLVFAGVITMSGYIIEQLYFRIEALKLLKLVSSVVLKNDEGNYLLEKRTQKRNGKPLNVLRMSQKIKRKIAIVVYAFQFLNIIGGLNYFFRCK